MQQEHFWMVVGNGAPYYRHRDESSAKREAERLAKLNPGLKFFVVKTIGCVESTSVLWHTTLYDPVPF